MMAWLIARGKERSTWYGLLALLAALGWHFTPEQADSVGTLAVALFGFLEIIRKDPESPHEISPDPTPRVEPNDRRADRLSFMLSDPTEPTTTVAFNDRDAL